MDRFVTYVRTSQYIRYQLEPLKGDRISVINKFSDKKNMAILISHHRLKGRHLYFD